MNVGPMQIPGTQPGRKISEDELEGEAMKVEAVEIDARDVGAKEITDDTVRRAWEAYRQGVQNEIDKARRQQKQGPWYLLNYVPAHVRVLAFRRDFPNGKIVVDCEPWNDGRQVFARAYIYRDVGEYSNETLVESEGVHEFVNGERKTQTMRDIPRQIHGPNWVASGRKVADDVERAETGATSRALGFLGYGAVAGIAEGEDVRDAQDGRRQRNAEHARQVAELNAQMAARRGRPELDAEQPKQEPKREDRSVMQLRKDLVEWIGRKRIFTLAGVESVFDAVDEMDESSIRDLARKLKDVKTSVAWERLAGSLSNADRWRPMLSMLDHLVDSGGTDQPIRLLYGANSPGELFCLDMLEGYAGKGLNLTTELCVVEGNAGWDGPTGHVTSLLQPDHVGGGNCDAYLCGPPPMIDAGTAWLRDNGLDEGSIHSEKFIPS